MSKTAPSEPPATKGKVVELTSGISPGASAGRRRRRGPSPLLLSFVLLVLGPIGAAIYYYSELVTDRYAATAGFAIRGFESGATFDTLGALTGLAGGGSTTSDSYIVLRYLESQEIVNRLDEKAGLRAAYSDPAIDPLSRLQSEARADDLLRYWLRRVDTQFDPTSGMIEFTVQSFSPEHAHQVATAALDLTQSLVNGLSETARQDSLAFAREEVALQESRLRRAQDELRAFRAAQNEINPVETARLDIELLAGLEEKLVEINSRITAQAEVLDSEAPSLRALRRQANALEEQITQRRAELTGTDATGASTADVFAVPDQITQFEELEIERRFAETAYASALSSLEQARRDADRQQRYLAVFLQPQVPTVAAYPERMQSILIITFAVFATWCIGALLAYSIRDHLT